MVTQLITAQLDYNCHTALKAMTAEDYAEIRDRLVEVDLPEDQDKIESWMTYKFIGTIDDVTILAEKGIRCSITRVRGLMAEALPQIGVPKPQGVQVVNVTIPSAGLFAVKKLEVLENECTDRVQTYLDRGWRIVAVCPPNDTRRPTYVMGHMEEEV